VQLFENACSCYALLVAFALSACEGGTQPANALGSAGASGAAGDGGLESSLASDSAQWPMPNSPGLGLPNPASYDSEATPGVVRDQVTGLDWLQDPGSELYSRADAISRCDELSFAGYDDWRVPAFIELVSLFDVTPNDRDPLAPSYIAPAFQARGRFWSSTPVTKAGFGRLLDFEADGCSASQVCSIGVAGDAEQALGGAFCVRNSEPPATSTRYQRNDDIVTDLRTGLSWQGVPATIQTVDHADGVSACAALGNGARLPSITELLSILVPVLDNEAFPGWPPAAFAWSSSAIAENPGTFWAGAIAGATRAEPSGNHNRVQCVR